LLRDPALPHQELSWSSPLTKVELCSAGVDLQLGKTHFSREEGALVQSTTKSANSVFWVFLVLVSI